LPARPRTSPPPGAGDNIGLFADCDRLIVLRVVSPEQAGIVYDGPDAPVLGGGRQDAEERPAQDRAEASCVVTRRAAEPAGRANPAGSDSGQAEGQWAGSGREYYAARRSATGRTRVH